MTEQFIAGIIGAPFGIKGFIKVKPLSGELDHLLKLKSVRLRKDGKDRLLDVEESTAIPPALAMHFAGYNSPEQVQELTGAELLVDRAEAAPLQPGEFYIEDLKGLEVLASDGGQILGRLTNIIEGGGAELAEIRLSSGELKLVPFRKEFIISIDLEKRQLTLQNLWVLE
jgi:16S rRNA processing protein RimM